MTASRLSAPAASAAERRQGVLLRDLDRDVDRDRPRLGLEDEREADDADAEQHDGADQALARARARLLDRVGRLERRLAAAGSLFCLNIVAGAFEPNAEVERAEAPRPEALRRRGGRPVAAGRARSTPPTV